MANALARVTELGVVTEFVLPDQHGGDQGAITTGADGNLWFVETMSNVIGRVSP